MWCVSWRGSVSKKKFAALQDTNKLQINAFFWFHFDAVQHALYFFLIKLVLNFLWDCAAVCMWHTQKVCIFTLLLKAAIFHSVTAARTTIQVETSFVWPTHSELWQLELLTLAIQSLILKYVLVCLDLLACVPSAGAQQEEEGWRQ